MCDRHDLDVINEEEEKERLNKEPPQNLEILNKQRIIDDILQSLHNSLKENSDLRIEIDVLQAKLRNDEIEKESLRKSIDWYRSELCNVKKRYSLAYKSSKCLPEKLFLSQEPQFKVALEKSLSTNACLLEMLELHKEQRIRERKEERPLVHESKDSGLFSESTSDTSTTDDGVSSTSKTATDDNHLQDFRQSLVAESPMLQRLANENVELTAKCHTHLQQVTLTKNLLAIQEQSVASLTRELTRVNAILATKDTHHETALNELRSCQKQINALEAEKRTINRESAKMIMKFQGIFSIIEGANVVSKKSVATQTNNPIGALEKKGNYYKNLLKVVEREYEHKMRQRDKYVRTLMRQLSKEMRLTRDKSVKQQYVAIQSEVKAMNMLKDICNEVQDTSSILAKANETLKLCAKFKSVCPDPLQEEILSMHREIKMLNRTILWRNKGEISLLDELEAEGVTCQRL